MSGGLKGWSKPSGNAERRVIVLQIFRWSVGVATVSWPGMRTLISDAPHEEDDDDSTLNGFIGMLAGVMICLPLWAAVAVVVILFLR
jgi:hypothetical protein